MSTTKTPLVQKLIFLVLLLNLGCLAILLVRTRPAPEPAPAVATSEATEEEPAPVIPKPWPVQPVAPSRRTEAPVVAPAPAVAGIVEVEPPSALAAALVRDPSVVVVVPPIVRSARVTPIAAGGGAGAATNLTGGVFGTVRLVGTPPAEKLIEMDATCAALQSGPVYTRHYVVSPEGGLANVVVYFRLDVPHFVPPPSSFVELDQVNCLFEPYVLAVSAGQPVRIRNSDPVLHNIHATPKVNREFNFAQPKRGSVTQRIFDKPELFIRLKCDVHPWMFAYVSVFPHWAYAVTDTNGVYRIPIEVRGFPFQVTAHHLKAGEVTQEIVLQRGETRQLDFTLSVPLTAGSAR